MPDSKDSKRVTMAIVYNLSPWKPRQFGKPKGTGDLSSYVLETTDGGKELIDALVFIAMTPKIQ